MPMARSRWPRSASLCVLPDGPVQAIGQKGPGHAQEMQAARLGEAERGAIERGAAIVERRFLGLPLRQDLREAAGLREGAGAIVEADDPRGGGSSRHR